MRDGCGGVAVRQRFLHIRRHSKSAPEVLDIVSSIRAALAAEGLDLPSAGTSYTIVVVNVGDFGTPAVEPPSKGPTWLPGVSRAIREAAATYDMDEPAEPDAGSTRPDFPPQFLREVGLSCPDLTPRELEILSWIVLRMDYREIATAAGLSYHTVRTHARNIYDKLGVRSRREAVERFAGFARHSSPGGMPGSQKAGLR